MDDLLARDEVELGQGQDAVSLQGGLEGEVVVLEGLEAGQPGGHEGHLDAAALAGLELLGEQLVDGLECRELALLEAAHHVIERFQGAGHLEADEEPAQPVGGGAGQGRDGGGHGILRLCSCARARPTCS